MKFLICSSCLMSFSPILTVTSTIGVPGDLFNNPPGHDSICPQLCSLNEHALEQATSVFVDVADCGQFHADPIAGGRPPYVKPTSLEFVHRRARQRAFDDQPKT